MSCREVSSTTTSTEGGVSRHNTKIILLRHTGRKPPVPIIERSLAISSRSSLSQMFHKFIKARKHWGSVVDTVAHGRQIDIAAMDSFLQTELLPLLDTVLMTILTECEGAIASKSTVPLTSPTICNFRLPSCMFRDEKHRTVLDLFRVAHIPLNYRAHVFFRMENIVLFAKFFGWMQRIPGWPILVSWRSCKGSASRSFII